MSVAVESCKFDFQGARSFISKHQMFELIEADIYCPTRPTQTVS